MPSPFVAAVVGFGALRTGFGCYYNHVLTVGEGDGAFNISWRDVRSGPLPGIGFQIAHQELVFELEADDVTGVSVGDKKYELSVPFTFNEVELHEKSLCDWGYGCAHCQHVGDDACSRRLMAISTVSDDVNGVNQVTGSGTEDFPEELPSAFQRMTADLQSLCLEYVHTDDVGEEFVTNDIIEACKPDCLLV